MATSKKPAKVFLPLQTINDWEAERTYLTAQKLTSNHANIDQKLRLLNGEKLELEWPNKKRTPAKVISSPRSVEYQDMGSRCTALSEFFAIEVEVNGAKLRLTNFKQLKARRLP